LLGRFVFLGGKHKKEEGKGMSILSPDIPRNLDNFWKLFVGDKIKTDKSSPGYFGHCWTFPSKNLIQRSENFDKGRRRPS